MADQGRPIKVLHLDTGIGHAGGQVALVEILKHLDRTRFEPLVASPSESRLRQVCSDLAIPWVPLAAKSLHLTHGNAESVLPSLYSAIWLVGAIRRRKIDLVHANTFKAALVAAGACRLVGCPLVFHDRIRIGHGALGRVVTGLADRIVVVSRAVGAKHRGSAARKMRLVYDGIDVERFAPRGWGPGPACVGFLGRLSEEKDLLALVDAARVVVAMIPGARFLVGGEPFTPDDAAYVERVKQHIRAAGLEARFEFAGFVRDVASFLAGIRVLALPSRHEALGLVVLEAMAAGKPVVAFAIGGPQETVRSGVDGLLVRPGDAEAFGRALAEVLGDQDKARRMGEKGRERVTDDFSSAASVGRLEDVFLEACDRRRLRPGPDRGEQAG
jgi:glycosyltransferase involved in cell wall biosynthesis